MMEMSEEQFERHGWRGVGVPVRLVGADAFVALASDPETRQPALSVWRQDGPGHRRETAFWMEPDAARRLALALLAYAERSE